MDGREPSVRRNDASVYTFSVHVYGRFNTFHINSRAISELLYQSVLYMSDTTRARGWARVRQTICAAAWLEVDSMPWLTNFRAASVATNYEKYDFFFAVVAVCSSRQLEWIQRLNEMNVRSPRTFL